MRGLRAAARSAATPRPTMTPRVPARLGAAAPSRRPSPVAVAASASASAPAPAPTPLNGGDMTTVPKTEIDWSKAIDPRDRKRRAENVDGAEFWVDSACISCRVCRRMVPSVFGKIDGQSAVLRAPEGHDERLASYQALLSCPTFSIHAEGKPDAALLREARDSFPIPAFPGARSVFCNGFTDVAAIATMSYLVKRGGAGGVGGSGEGGAHDGEGGSGTKKAPGGGGGGNGNHVLFDAPRYAGPVAEALVRECGRDGPAFFVLSHRDDIGEHGRWARRFPRMRRVVHEREARAVDSLGECEVILRGEGPWLLPDGGDDVLLLLTPGHTSGSITLLFLPEQVALTGDHLDAAPPPAEFGVVPPPPPSPGDDVQDLHVFRDYCWDSIDAQLASVAKLAGRGCISRVLPGHGSPALFGSPDEFDAAIGRLLAAELPGGAAEADAALRAAREALEREPPAVVPVAAADAAVVGR